MLKRWSSALIVVGGLIWTLASCEMEPTGPISAEQFHAMLNDVADGGAGFTFNLAELDSEAREEFLAMLPADADIGDGQFLVEAQSASPEEGTDIEESAAESQPLFWFWRRTNARTKWKKSVCYRIYNIDRNAHLSNCPHAGGAGPYDFVMRNRHQITGRCSHTGARALNYCDELIYTCSNCGKPRHYRWTYYHQRKYKS